MGWIEFKKLLAQLLFWLYDFLDLIGDIFRVLAGLETVGYTSEGTETEMSILDAFIRHTVAAKVIFGLVLISVVIACVCGIVKTVKGVIRIKTEGQAYSHTATLGQTFLAILSSMVCILLVFLFISFSSMLLQQVNGITSQNIGTTKLSQQLFNLSVESTYEIDYDNPQYEYVIKVDENGMPVQKTDADGNLVWLHDEFGNWIDEKGNYVDEDHKVPDYEMTTEIKYDYKKDANGNYEIKPGYRDGKGASDIDFAKMPVDEVFGIHFKVFGRESKHLGYMVKPMVEMESFNLFTAFLVAIVMLISMIMICLGMVKRLYDIVVLIFMMPLVCGSIPLDDGARFRAWREVFMSKVFLVFGAVIAINVFFQISPIIEFLNFHTISGIGLVQDIVKMFLYMGGALCINASQTLIARVLGTSADESRELTQSFRTIMGGASIGAGGIVGAKNMTFGGYNKYGRHRTGLIPGIKNLISRSGTAATAASAATPLSAAVGAAVAGARYVGKAGASVARSGANGVAGADAATLQSVLSSPASVGACSSTHAAMPKSESTVGSRIADGANVVGKVGSAPKPYRDNTKKKK